MKNPLSTSFAALAALAVALPLAADEGMWMPQQVPDLAAKLRERGFEGELEMDGGLNAETLPRCAEAGANALVAGSAIFGAADPGEALRAIRTAATAS